MRQRVPVLVGRAALHRNGVGFHRIRHCGLFANGHRADKLTLCRALLDVPTAESDRTNGEVQAEPAPALEPPACPCCGGRMMIIETFEGAYANRARSHRARGF